MSSSFLYDLDSLALWAARIRAAFPAEVELFYACKANPLSAILRTLARQGFGFDLASPGELRQALRHASGSRLLCTGPAKTAAFFAEALESGVRLFVLESRAQLETLERCSAERNQKVQALLRLQLPWAEGRSVLGGAQTSVFGMEPSAWLEILREQNLRFVSVEGVHVFQWGNENSLSRLETIWRKVLEEAQSFSAAANLPLNILDLGGGLGLPYDGGTLLEPEAVGGLLCRLRAQAPRTRFLLELGRYVVGPCGTYSTTIVDRKTVRGENFLITEGGAQHLLRPALVGQAFPVRLQRESSAPSLRFRVHGPLCTALDQLGTFDLPADCRAGDRLEFSLAGAYGFTESMPFFLCHEGAAELIREKGEIRVLREAMNPEEWLR